MMDLEKFVGLERTSKYGSFVPMVYAFLAVILLPYIHIGIVHLKLWVPDKRPVDKEKCTCSCFDTVFKGSYEQPGTPGYKHVYFNATENTFKIWVLTVFFLLLLYESVKHLLTLFRTAHLHFGWTTLFIANIYPHYYSWWNFWGYYNDEFYSFFHHQLFFSITEMFISVIVINQCNTRATCQSWKLLAIISISLVHIIVSGWDQFVTNVFRAKGGSFQMSRDLGLMIPDIGHMAFTSFQYWRLYLSKKSNNCIQELLHLEFAAFVALTVCLTFIPTVL